MRPPVTLGGLALILALAAGCASSSPHASSQPAPLPTATSSPAPPPASPPPPAAPASATPQPAAPPAAPGSGIVLREKDLAKGLGDFVARIKGP